ncbi:MAG: alkaline phosphatase family protein [Acidobacteriota bacterium]|nr:MAG: alkaline phosphatase family protein [Acidobacteriota bacterium]
MTHKLRNDLIVAIVMVFAFAALPAFAQQPIEDLKPTVILISLDGFRYDYVDKYEAPTIRRLATEGVRAKWMIPSFPTKTFPNHYTVVTGLYPANHGLVENNVFDFGTVFTMSKREEVENPRWWGGEPIWVTAESQGQIAASFFWVGSEAKVKDRQPTYWKRYDGKVPNEERVDTVLSWLDLPREKRPTIITLYFSDTDDAGHAAGPDSEAVKNAVKKVDGDIARLVEGLKKRKIDGKANIIITSDHGMAAVPAGNVVYIYRALREEWLERDPITTGEIWQIWPKPERTDEMMTALARLENTTCWRKADIPDRFHYKQGARVAPVICSAKLGWSMSANKRPPARPPTTNDARVRGAHGFDNQYQEMQATFIAHGRAFKKNKTVEPFANVEVYNVMCKILGIKPAPNDGDLRRVKSMLR